MDAGAILKNSLFHDFFFDEHTGIVYCLYCKRKFPVKEITVSHIVKKSARPSMKDLSINKLPHCHECHLGKFEFLNIDDRLELVDEWAERWPVLEGRSEVIRELMKGFTIEETGEKCDRPLFLKKCGGKIIRAGNYLLCKKCSNIKEIE